MYDTSSKQGFNYVAQKHDATDHGGQRHVCTCRVLRLTGHSARRMHQYCNAAMACIGLIRGRLPRAAVLEQAKSSASH